MTQWKDETIMPWGKHKGEKLEDIPATYFLWLQAQSWIPDWPGLHGYIERNLDAFKLEVGEEKDDEPGHGYDSYEQFRSELE